MNTALKALLVLFLALSVGACADFIDGPFHGRDHDSSHSDSTDDSGNDTTHNGGTDTTNTGSGSDTTKVDTTVCFSRDILPILVSNCAMAKCHDEASHKEGVVLTTYASTMHLVTPGNPSRSELYSVITESDPEEIMPPPPGKLSQTQINLIARWIREGATNRDCSNDTPCNTSNVTYVNTIAPVMEKWCTGCHGASGPSAGIDLTNRSVVEAQARSGALVGTVSHATGFAKMPPSGPKLDDCSIVQIKAWVAGGLK